MNKRRVFTILLYMTMLVTNLIGPIHKNLTVQAQSSSVRRADAVVLVNSTSANYLDFEHFIQPYLDNLGVPYTLLDISTTPVEANINEYALIIIGHRQLDAAGTLLDSIEEGYISAAVNAGAGLVNFDNDLSSNGAALYEYVSSIFNFGYTASASLSNITITDASHYITQSHAAGESITTGSMTLAGITLPASATALAAAGSASQPFLVTTTYGQGRAVQWGTYDWMSHAVKGPVYDLDDLVWRSLVWAARKPFVMQGMPPLITMRMDDAVGPFDWIHVANDYGFIPWAGVFINNIDAAEAADLSSLTNAGKASIGLHAFTTTNFFYFDHSLGQNFSDTQIADNFTQGTQWFQANNIPISKYIVGHYYELGSNVFAGLQNWGVEYVGTMMNPGSGEAGSNWVQNGPFRKYETGLAGDLTRPVFYADYLTIPGHPEQSNTFFNCVTEMRDIANYEWHPSPNIQVSVDTGTRWLTRAVNNMELATLFTHEYDLGDITMTEWRQIMQGISQNLSAYQPMYVSMEYACQYARAMHNASIASGSYDVSTNQLVTNFAGAADIATRFYVFSESAGQIQQVMVDVPAFNGATQVTYSPPGQLHHIVVSPNPASVVSGGTQQFAAQGYDINNTLIPNLGFTWQVVNGGGTIDDHGLFTAGLATGSYADTIVAANSGVSGRATVNVIETTLHHFAFDTIPATVYTGMAFQVTLRAQDVNNNPVVGYTGPATLSDTTGTIQPVQTGTFTNGVWSGAVTIGVAASGVAISASDGSFTGSSNAFNVSQLRACPCSIWSSTDSPLNLNVTDNVPIELGVKFRSDIDGYITGLRFYKGYQNTGAHVGHLWSSAGTLLATATFAGETASGWQQAALDAPVFINANTTYIASYFSPSGYFSDTPEGFATAVANPPLKALASGEDGANGVYRDYTSGFPTQNWAGHTPNYWVDVVFELTVGPDTTPPVALSMTPASGATGINVNTNASAVFNERINSDTVNASTFELRDAANALVPAMITYTSANLTATLDPTAALEHSVTYTAILKGGAAGIKDLAGNALAADVTWSFTTAAAAPPPPDEGPGGPILILSSADNPFSRYYTEILRAEGLNAFMARDISQVTALDLVNYDVVLLGEMPLTASQVSMLETWVSGGGNLIAMRPGASLNNLMGLSALSGTLAEGYLRVDTSRAPGAGIVGETIQYHGAADLHALNGAASIATLYQDAATQTGSPAVSINAVGASGGQAAAFAFDLARSVVYTRQGNPNWAGQERDGLTPIRTNDLFYGNAAFDLQPDWVNLNKVAIPQADEMQRLLANLILYMNADRQPLPRFWYLPRGEKAAVLMTGDDHNGGGTAGRFDYYLAQSPAGCSVDNWDCIRATAYIYPENPLTDASAAYYQAQGFEIALHLNTNCVDFTPDTLASFYTSQLSAWQAKYPSLSAPVTERTHCIVWSDWDSQVKTKLANHIRLDLNYYFWPPAWIQNRPGFFTGSGMPMRFADINGTQMDVYQVVTQMTDESGQTYPYTIDTLLDRALGAEGYYGIFTANMHHDTVSSSGATAIITSAMSRGVPVVSAAQVQKWLDGRNASTFTNLAWHGGVLSFQVAFGEGSNGLQVLLPAQSGIGVISGMTLNGTPVAYTLETIKGVQYAAFLANVGTYQAMYLADTTPPVISGVSAAPGANNSAAISWTTNEPSDARVDYGTDAGLLNLYATDPTLATSHAITLSNLAPGTTYYYRVTSKDAFNNSAVWPASGSAPASFTTQALQFVDTTTADFQAGTPGAGIYISQMEDGEVILSPALGEEFSGSSLPAGWSSSAWTTGGNSTVSNQQLVVDGARANTTASYSAGRAIEFYATFGAATYQHAGFGQTLGAFSESWAMFSTMGTTTGLYARTNNAGVTRDVYLSGSWIGAPHRFRIEWNPSNIVFLIDGVVVHTETVSISASMRPVFSDYTYGGPALRVDWLRVTPYAASGVFVSRVFDAGFNAQWTNITWTSRLPAGAGLALSARAGNTPVPDASWTAFAPLSTQGSTLPDVGRYFQYQAGLTTSAVSQTPVLENVAFSYTAAPVLAPLAVADVYTTAEDTLLSVPAAGVLTNDSSPSHNALSAVLVSGPANGTLALNADGSFTYAPVANYNGTDSFTYQASDGANSSAAATVTIDVTPVNDPPIAVSDSYSLDEDQVLTVAAKGVLENDTDIDSPILTAVLVSGPANGALILNADGSFTYTPAANYNGADSFTYQASDGALYSNTATVTLTINPVNDPPVARDDAYSLNMNRVLTVAAPGVIQNDTDVDSATLTAVLGQPPSHGTLTLNADGSFTYTPAADYYGSDSFTYQASDGLLLSNVASVTLQVADTTIFKDGFESGNLSAWSSSVTGGGNLSVSASAALGGTAYGMRVWIRNNNAIYVVDTSPAAETAYHARFAFDPNTIPMARGDTHVIFSANTSAYTRVLTVEFRYYNSGYQIRAGVMNNSRAWTYSSWFTISDAPHAIQADWTAATSTTTGSAQLWIDGVQRYARTGINNSTHHIEQISLGAVSGLDTGTRGAYYLDEFMSWR